MKKILVIDDDADILELVQCVLKKAGFEVHTHNSGFDAVAKITECNPNAILLDIQLPGKSGTDIYKELRKTNHVPVVFFSANADKQKVLSECKAEAFISKPFDINQLLHTINEYASCA
ncbi:MAG: response regulator [Bacteroidota bacterium]|nr:response regulator [Bacteroidota bacterium]